MRDITFALDHDSSLGLQHQLRQKIMDAIYRGVLPPGSKLPSSRSLSLRLGVSRNTVTLAYAALTAEGHLVGRDRSGIFVAEDVRTGPIVGRRKTADVESPLAEMFPPVGQGDEFRCPPNWRQYPYPFLDGCIEPGLTPVREWREAMRFACSPRDARDWSGGNGEVDDPMLVGELRKKILPERGIDALPEEMLVFSSTRQALQLLAELLVRTGAPVWLEEPVDFEFMQGLHKRRARLERFDSASPSRLPQGAIVVTSARKGIESGSHTPQWLLREIRRCDGVIIEQDTPPDVDEPEGFAPAIYAGKTHGRVVYVGSLSPVVASGLPLAVVVAPPAVIERLRRLRRAAGATPAPLQQRAWAYFVGLGHYAAGLHRARRVLGERRAALRDALNHYLHSSVVISTVPGASTHWVRCNDDRNANALARQAASLGTLVRPGRMPGAQHAFAMGVTGIELERIREGVRSLARLFYADAEPCDQTHAIDASARPLSGARLRRELAGKTLIYNTVYGEPCSIRVLRNGELQGVAGHASDDRDSGRWWVEKDRWFRQWRHWAYGEASGFRVVIEDHVIRWYGDDGLCVDRAIIVPTPRGKRGHTSSGPIEAG